MKKWMAMMLIGLLALQCGQRSANDAVSKETLKQKDARMEWWREARFGMFIHWGVYSVPAGIYRGKEIPGIGEWIMNNAKIPMAGYQKYAKRFNPVKYDPDAWVKLAKEAGMKYIVITSKHHDGFALFDTQASDWNAKDATPYGKDLLKPLSEACQKHGIRLGFYYSQAQDWNHPGGAAVNGHWDKAQDGDMTEYIRTIAVPQVKEILSNYGPISVLWWDTPEGMTKERADLLLPLLKLQPGIIQNNRLGGGYDGDTETPEQFIPATGFPGRDWETCMTMNDTWGYKSTDHNWKSAETLIRNLVDIASKGGNYLLNVGPTSEGLIPEPSVERLKAVGQWMRVNGEAVYATQASPFKVLEWGRCTQKPIPDGTRLFLHVFDWPKDGKLKLAGIFNDPKKAYLLSDPDRAPLPVERDEDALVVSIPAQAPDLAASVVVLDVKGRPDIADPPTISADFSSFVDSTDVTLQSPREKVKVRYTLDGSDPSASSPISNGLIRLKKTTTVSARCFRGKKPVSGTVRSAFTRVEPIAEEKVPQKAAGLRWSAFEGEWNLIPNFSRLRPVKRGIAKTIDFTNAPRIERFGLVFEGFVLIPKTGMYAFYTASDDGSRLLIGGRQVVLNDGLHAGEEKRGEIALAEGLHSIRVEYFQKLGGAGLGVSWQGPGIVKQMIPGMYFRHRP